MLIKKEIVINSDVKKVWKMFCQLEGWPKWGGYIIDTRWIFGEKWKKGSQFLQVVKGFGVIKQLKSLAKVLEVKNYNAIKWAGTRKFIKGTHTFKFEKIGNKTRVTNIENFTGLLAPVIFPLIKNKFNMYFEQFLNGLKKEAEKQ